MRQTLKEMFAPTWTKVLLTAVTTVFAHVFIAQSAVRQATATGAVEVQHFWLANLVNALPYLETQNSLLKFLTFFVVSYLLIWLVTRFFHLLDNLQILATRKLRRHQ